jgi:hypothetical protein
MADKSQRQVPQQVRAILKRWQRYNQTWRTVHFILGCASTLCLITVAANPTFLPPWSIQVIALISAILTAWITFLKPTKLAYGYINAVRVLRDACYRFEYDPSYPVSMLFDAVNEGEELIATGNGMEVQRGKNTER